MPAQVNHRRRKFSSLTRAFIAVSTGGAALTLPMIGATVASAAPAQPVPAAVAKTVAPAAAPAKPTAVRAATPTVYSVIAGDSLYKIALSHSVSGGWQQLYKDNRAVIGADPSVIHAGQKLTIGASAPAAVASTTAASTAAAVTAKPATYTNDLDGWIKESLAVMAQHGIPGSYDGIHRNIMRESAGNPRAINNWDSNAAKGTPSKGLLQVIDPTFRAYHVPGTSMDPYDPVANITAACNYAAAKYGSIDNVFGAY
ncbi:LysM peptidoglycan-binding domain-containing protein [Streptomyces sp. NPDC005969]|uniref:transglycosylase SLT domain-containing protein n=1 Tax=Streptomyces sp. NPDC005969 TaxID=3156722 RepID=UPI003405A751